MGDSKIKTKYAEDYVDDLLEDFPGIERKSMTKIVKFLAKIITMFMRRGAREFVVSSQSPLVKGDRKKESFYITRIFNLWQRKSVLSKAYKERENGKK